MTIKEPRNLEREEIDRAIARCEASSTALAFAYGVQERLGYVPERAVSRICEVAGVGEEDLRRAIDQEDGLLDVPLGLHRVLVCTGVTCARRGGANLLRQAREKLGIDAFKSTPGGAVRLEPFRCFGQCAQAPTIRMDGSLRGAMTEKRFDLLLDLFLRDEV